MVTVVLTGNGISVPLSDGRGVFRVWLCSPLLKERSILAKQVPRSGFSPGIESAMRVPPTSAFSIANIGS